MTRQTSEGWWVINGSLRHTKWIEENRRLDHDRYLIPTVTPLIAPGSIVIDCGAHVGSHTVAYMEAVGPHGLIYAIEPHLESFECLVKNCWVQQERLWPGNLEPHVKCINAALGSKLHTGTVHLYNNPEDAGCNCVADEGEEVPVTTIDALRLVNSNRISLIKIDCEGSEPDVIMGGSITIAWHRPSLVIEINQGALARQSHSAEEIRQMLKSLGYRRVQWCPPEANWETTQCDIICFAS